jgi:sialic acid synthase SpsE
MRLFPKAAFGYADHTEWDHPDNLLLTLMGGLDKTYIEKHVSISPGEKRIDYESAISIDQFNQLRDWLDLAEKAEGTGAFSTNWGEAQYGQIGPMRKAMIACRDFAKGEPFDMDSIIYQRTARTSDLLPFMIQGFTPFFEQDVKAGQIITGKMLTRQK